MTSPSPYIKVKDILTENDNISKDPLSLDDQGSYYVGE